MNWSYVKIMKSLLINAGFGWCATTPLFRTLCRTNDYCIKKKTSEGGFPKEPHLLLKILERHTDDRAIRDAWNIIDAERFATIEGYVEYINNLPGERVTDFSNTNADLPEEFIDAIAPTLLNHFDVKVTMIVRDPVRRYYSLCNHLYKKDIRNRIHGDIIQYFRHMLQHCSHSYVRTYRMYSKWFPTYSIVMEDLWKNPEKELPKLSEFLEYPLKKLHPNVYHDGVKHDKLKDQWTDDIPLSPIGYQMARKELQWVYDEWMSEFGNIPSSWC